ncbi:outer membrane protein assembly factor BamB family protein [Dinghuibacter silviterrae]|uniref:Outer membrane protein assembly factor BamB n=1 Tax=Dinghuibacter silviterrae TaxID=1539049 RepID=A0A4R8DP83_9BACT|nr:PQQ-binding-like beta-propeller repeat protein [Dinghuibacter silviterrae]TDW99919.1 outer membrane protein assembly factor BamB [Dinghuibacter silviterrae]
MKKYIAILACLPLIQCKKKDAPKPWYPAGTPSITAVQFSDYCDGIITITGTNFDSVPSGVSVTLGSLTGQILSATQTKLVVKIPAATFAGTLNVVSEHIQLYWPDSLYKEPTVIDSISPSVAGTGTMVTINGQFFNPVAAEDTVYFNHIPATILSATARKIVVRVPAGVTTGHVAVQSGCKSAVAQTSFTNSNKGTIYISDNDGYFYALDVTSGAPKWTIPLNGANSPAFANGVLYVACGGNDSILVALDPNTGVTLWTFTSAPWEGTPTIYQGVVYMGAINANFYAIDAATGQQKWVYNAGLVVNAWGNASVYNGSVYTSRSSSSVYSLDLSTGALNWRRDNIYAGTPVAANGLVYVSGYDSAGEISELYALNAADGTVAWVNPITELNGTPTVSNGVVYVGSFQHFYAFNATTGAQIWSVPIGSLGTVPQVVDNSIYLASSGVVLSLNAANGQQNWLTSLVSNTFAQGGLVVAHGIIYVGGNDGNVYAVDASTGKVIWASGIGGVIASTPCVVDSAGVVFQAQQ